MRILFGNIMGLTLALTSIPGLAQDNANSEQSASRAYSPYVDQTHPNHVYWGDSHLHTSYSWDAGLVGNTHEPGCGLPFRQGRTGNRQFGPGRQTGATAGLAGRRRPR